jgi:hypothetical protein
VGNRRPIPPVVEKVLISDVNFKNHDTMKAIPKSSISEGKLSEEFDSTDANA